MAALALTLAGVAACGSDDSATTLPPTDSTTPAAGEPITVDQLVARSADTPIAVTGLLIGESGGAVRLCAMIMESYPPQCGGESVELVGLDLASVDGTTEASGVTWKEGAVLTVQRTSDGRFELVAA